MPKCIYISLYKSFDIAPNILYIILFVVNCSDTNLFFFKLQSVRPHHTAAPWRSLATSATADRVQTRCARFPLPAWYGCAIPCTRTVPCGRHGLSSSTPFRFDARAARSTDASRHRRRPRFRSLRSSRLQRSAIWRHHVAIAHRLQTTAQDTDLQPLVWSLTVWFLFCRWYYLFCVVKCSWSFFWLYGTIIILVHHNNNNNSNNNNDNNKIIIIIIIIKSSLLCIVFRKDRTDFVFLRWVPRNVCQGAKTNELFRKYSSEYAKSTHVKQVKVIFVNSLSVFWSEQCIRDMGRVLSQQSIDLSNKTDTTQHVPVTPTSRGSSATDFCGNFPICRMQLVAKLIVRIPCRFLHRLSSVQGCLSA